MAVRLSDVADIAAEGAQRLADGRVFKDVFAAIEAAGWVTSDRLAADAVLEGKIADGAITPAKLSGVYLLGEDFSGTAQSSTGTGYDLGVSVTCTVAATYAFHLQTGFQNDNFDFSLGMYALKNDAGGALGFNQFLAPGAGNGFYRPTITSVGVVELDVDDTLDGKWDLNAIGGNSVQPFYSKILAWPVGGPS